MGMVNGRIISVNYNSTASITNSTGTTPVIVTVKNEGDAEGYVDIRLFKYIPPWQLISSGEVRLKPGATGTVTLYATGSKTWDAGKTVRYGLIVRNDAKLLSLKTTWDKAYPQYGYPLDTEFQITWQTPVTQMKTVETQIYQSTYAPKPEETKTITIEPTKPTKPPEVKIEKVEEIPKPSLLPFILLGGAIIILIFIAKKIKKGG